MLSIERRCVTGPEKKYTVCRRVRASFSPEVLQARTVKGLVNGEHNRPYLRLADVDREGAFQWEEASTGDRTTTVSTAFLVNERARRPTLLITAMIQY